MAKTASMAGLRTKIQRLKAQPRTPKRAEVIRALQVQMMQATMAKVAAR